MIYLDTSALVKRFVEERGSRSVDVLMQHAAPVATSVVAYAELFAGLARKRRDGFITAQHYKTAANEIDREWPTYILVRVTEEVLAGARALVERHPLRGFDALHLASALHLARLAREPIQFVAADAHLLAAATSEQLEAADLTRD
jgi:predicted nucleic acid-binding protein